MRHAPYATLTLVVAIKRTAIETFQKKKDAIYALYRDEVGKLMEPDIVKGELAYYDDFYDEIKTPRDAEANILKRCLGPR